MDYETFIHKYDYYVASEFQPNVPLSIKDLQNGIYPSGRNRVPF